MFKVLESLARGFGVVGPRNGSHEMLRCWLQETPGTTAYLN